MQARIPSPQGTWKSLNTNVFGPLLPFFFWAVCMGCAPLSALQAQDEPLRQYTELIMAMLTERVEAAVHLEGETITLSPRIPALLLDCQKLVRRSVPYYLEGEIPRFKRFDDPVRRALENLAQLRVGSPPDGWTAERWTYYRVQRAIEDVLLHMALDVGAYANSSLRSAAFSTTDLSRDWSDMRAGVDEMQVDPIDPFDAGRPSDNSSLGGATSSGATGATDATSSGAAGTDPTMALLVRVLAGMEAILAELTGTATATNVAATNTLGLDEGWNSGAMGATGGQPGLPAGLPKEFTIAFPEGSNALGLSAEYALNALIELMAVHPKLRVIAEGHSDPTGGERHNMKLSQQRANAVRYYLIGHGLDPSRVVATHWGESKPEWGAGMDRRVVVRLLK